MYFIINSDKINNRENRNMDEIVNLLPNDPSKIYIYI